MSCRAVLSRAEPSRTGPNRTVHGDVLPPCGEVQGWPSTALPDLGMALLGIVQNNTFWQVVAWLSSTRLSVTQPGPAQYGMAWNGSCWLGTS